MNENDEDDKLSTDIILNALPMRWRRRGQVILGYTQNSTLNWDGKGQLIHGDTIICGTNLSDLLKDALYHSDHLYPRGLKEFYAGLAAVNLPDGLISNLHRRELLQRFKNHETPMETDESPTKKRTWKLYIIGYRKLKPSLPSWVSFKASLELLMIFVKIIRIEILTFYRFGMLENGR